MRSLAIVSLVFLLAGGLAVSVVASTVTYNLSIATNASSYGAAQAITISGKVAPNPGPNTGVFVQVFNPTGALVLAGESNVNASSGKYSFNAVTGGSSAWVSGTYSVNASWGAYGPPLNAKTSFAYSAVTPTTSVSSSTTTTPTTTSSAITSSTGSGGIPEFPFELSAMTIVALLVTLSYVFVRRGIAKPTS